ncbi:hypothetical protein JYQ62_02145 [Nostoc sp. UHCC 0702]|nr:hypothetical protein JYQ62_02145 [Nostoc sp. UHCC 0702]
MSNEIVLRDDDVVSITGNADSIPMLNFGLKATFKSSELINAARAWIATTGHETCSYSTWLKKEGLRCQVLLTNGMGWKSGKVRFRIEFIPDEPEVSANPTVPSSPLDDLRSSLNI